ncbi:hypothetical protein BN14_02569 [Rhizoctonia solani AG-1 IB]|uniref:hydroxyacylglutathione hydrolase n=1 Tax=Thanatephorus cucumeris (strain AG1-IB / isolate 7/3/14) TaxID=1108050 RepID=M5BNG6_THACB|nr:hypothetical protein BN14_02569 [Rhizoctonia solani AG-1 IB]
MRVVPVPVRSDNYAYLLIDEATKKAAAVDPFDVPKVQAQAEKEGVELTALITTHHHADHSGGNKEFHSIYPNAPVYGGSDNIPELTHPVKDGDTFSVGENIKVKCLATPCHTQDSICYYVQDTTQPDQKGVFTGDTLFLAGCGRFFEGTAPEMHEALSYLGTLPDETVVYNGHEYTKASLAFGAHIDPNAPGIDKLRKLAEESVTTGKSTIADEKQWNVFMRLDSDAVRAATKTQDDVEAMGNQSIAHAHRLSSFRSLRVISMADAAKQAALQHALHELKVALEHVFISRYMGVAGYALLIYDHILTFPAELELVWKADKRNTVTWLFFANRYIVPIILGIDLYDKGGLASHLSTTFCQAWFVIEGYLNVLSFAAVHALVAMRVNAVWGRRKWVSILLWTSGILYIVGTLAIISPGIFQVLSQVAPNPVFNVCFGTITTYFWAVWIPPIVFELIIFSLTIIKAVEHRHKNVKTPVAYTLYRDGFLYFVIIMMCSIFPLIVWLAGPPTLVAMPKYFTMAVVNVMGFRLVLNLRGLRGDRIMASSGGATSDDMNMEMSDIKGSRVVPNRSGFSPAPIHVRPAYTTQNSDLLVPAHETQQANPAIDVRWQNRQVAYADQQPFDRSSNIEKGYPPGFGPGRV